MRGTVKTLISIRLEGWEIGRAKELARRRGVPYQQLIRNWIDVGIRKALREEGERVRYLEGLTEARAARMVEDLTRFGSRAFKRSPGGTPVCLAEGLRRLSRLPSSVWDRA